MGYCELSFCFDPRCNNFNPACGPYPAVVEYKDLEGIKQTVNLSGSQSRAAAKHGISLGGVEKEVVDILQRRFKKYESGEYKL